MNTIAQLQDIRTRIEREWDKKAHAKLNWLMLETLLVDILRLDGPEGVSDFRIALVKEAIDAFTHRGHFVDQYMTQPASTKTVPATMCDAVRDMERPSRACDLPEGHEGSHHWGRMVGLYPQED